MTNLYSLHTLRVHPKRRDASMFPDEIQDRAIEDIGRLPIPGVPDIGEDQRFRLLDSGGKEAE